MKTHHPPTGIDVPVEAFGVQTHDGVWIRGVEVTRSAETSTAIVLCHGFTGTWRRSVGLAKVLANRFGVFCFDFRGHGSSDGLSTLGDREALDVHAVVELALSREYERVVTVGASMGGIAVLREAASFGDVDGVVTISAPAQWTGHSRGARLSGLLVATRPGRVIARRLLRTRIYPTWTWTPPPVDLVEAIHVPLVVVHGSDDRFVGPEQAVLLHARAREPKRLSIRDGFGHAEAGYTPAFAQWLAVQIVEILGG
jgi:pimeloyl-ACP methyl ester carboxylesterase